jgi:AraC family transcriptional activator of mtrCDE
MLLDADLIEKVLEGYRYIGTIILHPTYNDAFIDEKKAMKNKLPFHYIEQGRCTVTVGDKEYHLEQGDLITMMKGSQHRITNFSGEPPAPTTLICGYFELSAGSSKPLIDSFPEVQMIRHNNMGQSARMKMVLEMLIEEVHKNQLGSKTVVNNLANLFFVHILRQVLKNHQVEKGLLAGLSDKQLSGALSAFHQDISKQWSLESLSKEAALSRTKFIEKFRVLIGITPAVYMAQWRMNWAASQLNFSDESIYNIALSAGYQSDAAFCRVFRQHFDLAPSEYRKQKNV